MFDTCAITAIGRSLMASATATNRIVFTQGLTDTTYRDLATIQNYNSSSLNYPSVGDATGNIFGVYALNNTTTISCRFSDVQTGINVHGVWILAKLENQQDSQAIPFCAAMDATEVYFPPASDVGSKIDIIIHLNFEGTPTATVLQTGAASPEYVDALRNDVFSISKSVCRNYDNFIQAQAFSKDGEAFTIDPHGINYFKIKKPTWQGLNGNQPSSFKITSICDMYLAVVMYYNSNNYVNIFDLREATFDGEELKLGNPVVYSRLGDESSSYGYVTIANVEGQHFAFAYTNSNSSNLWWYNDSFGQNSGDKTTGRGAVMPINTFTKNNYTFNRGWWYQIETGTAIGARAIGGEFVILTKDISTTDPIYIKQCTLNPQSSTMPLGGTSNKMTNQISNCYIDRELSGGSYNYINNMFVLKKNDFYIAIGSMYDEGYAQFKGIGAAMVNGFTGDGVEINDQFSMIYGSNSYGSLFYRACGFPYDYSSYTDLSHFFGNNIGYNPPRVTKTYDGLIFTANSAGNSYYVASKSAIVEGGSNGYIEPPWTVNPDTTKLTTNGHTYTEVYGINHCVMQADCGYFIKNTFGMGEFIEGYDYILGVGLMAGMANLDATDLMWIAYAPPKYGGKECKVLGKI